MFRIKSSFKTQFEIRAPLAKVEDFFSKSTYLPRAIFNIRQNTLGYGFQAWVAYQRVALHAKWAPPLRLTPGEGFFAADNQLPE